MHGNFDCSLEYKILKRWSTCFKHVTDIAELQGKFLTVFADIANYEGSRVEIVVMNHEIAVDATALLDAIAIKITPDSHVQFFAIVTDKKFEATAAQGIEPDGCTQRCVKYCNDPITLLRLLTATINETIHCTNKVKILDAVVGKLFEAGENIFTETTYTSNLGIVDKTSIPIEIVASFVSKIRRPCDSSAVLVEKASLETQSMRDFSSSCGVSQKDFSCGRKASGCGDYYGRSRYCDSSDSASSCSSSSSSVSSAGATAGVTGGASAGADSDDHSDSHGHHGHHDHVPTHEYVYRESDGSISQRYIAFVREVLRVGNPCASGVSA